MENKEPTPEQIKELWEWFKIKPIRSKNFFTGEDYGKRYPPP